MSKTYTNPETIGLHAGWRKDDSTNSVAVPIHQTSSFQFDDCDHAANLFALSELGNIYSRIMNPTCAVLEDRIAALEGGVGALAVASGQAASAYAIQNIARKGDNIVASSHLYGGTYNQFKNPMSDMGIEVRFVDPDDPNNFGDHWHTDQIFTRAPAMATMLYAKEVPEIGGDTLFACMEHAYDALSDGMKTVVGQLFTFNQYDKQLPRSGKMSAKIPSVDKPTTPAIHPLVRRHPETGRPSLYLTDMETTLHFDNMTQEESRPLIKYLLRHATRPEFTCRLEWQIGTLGIWDNRKVLHMALNDYPGKRRVMHRITMKGNPPIAFNIPTNS